MVGLIERRFADYNLPSFRGSYDLNQHEETNMNEESNNQIQLDANSECHFSKDAYVELKSKKNKYQNNEFFTRCKNANDSMWAAARKKYTLQKRALHFLSNS